jgi:hypothetical protein
VRAWGRKSESSKKRRPLRHRAAGWFLVSVLVGLLVVPPLSAAGVLAPLNDLLSLGHAGGQTPNTAPTQQNAEPPLVATPRAKCLAGSRKEPGIQGRVPNGAGSKGFHCNVSLVSHQGNSGGFKVHRYIDPAGHECGFYDTALLFPTNATRLDGTSGGVVALDMSDPAHPRKTATLNELPMKSPHESLGINTRRGLLAAVLGNPSTYPGLVSIYDIKSDCRHPKLQSTKLVARFGHESGFSADGRTFYATGTAVQAISAIDVTNPKNPHSIWQGNVTAHGMSLSEDGNRGYVAAPGGYLDILDTSQIQARRSNPQAREIARLTWKAASIPQNAIPFTRNGKPYLMETDEYTAGTSSGGNKDSVGAARIIDISDEAHPRVLSLMRLQVNQEADHKAASGDPGALSPVQGYAAHYCDVSSKVDPKVVACSFIASGLRVFDISSLTHPKEIAYHVAPTKPRFENGNMASAYAMSKPAFVPARREVWYSDGATGFNVLRVDRRVWPAGGGGGDGCLPRRLRIGSTRIGKIRLGYRRGTVTRRLPEPQRKTRRSFRWCVKGARGSVTAVFDRHGRVALITTTSRTHSARRVHTISRTRSLRRAYRRTRAIGRGLLRASRSSHLLFGVRRGRVRFVAVGSRSLIAHRRSLRRYLHLAGLRR